MEEAKNAWKSDSYNSSSSVRVAPAEMVKTNKKDKTSLLLGYYEVVDRERLENDVNNVGVMAALLGGFALNSLDEKLGTFIYILAVIAVHACTCACLAAALIYRVVNKLHDNDVVPWVRRHKIILSVPLGKFVMGAMAYLLIVIVRSWYAMEGNVWARYLTLAIGVMSMSMSIITYILLSCDTPIFPPKED